jgi:transposase InsO family protein
MPVPRQVDPHTGADTTNDPALMAICHMGLDILGPFPRAVSGFWYLYVAIDKFTKWPEATPMVKINKQSTIKFIKSIICKFGIPNRFITDNGFQFTSSTFQGYCEDLGIQNCYVFIAHPKSNGQVERANAKILKGLKTRTYDCLKKHWAKWINELPCALSANRTSLNRATGETPFFLVYEAEPVISLEVTMVSSCVQTYNKVVQDQLQCDDVDLVDERR